MLVQVRRVGGRHERALGDLDDQGLAGQARVAERVQYGVGEGGVIELTAGRVDRYGYPVFVVPPTRVLARGAQDPGADGQDEPAALRDRDELGGRDQRAAVGQPPQQRLDRHDPARVQVEDRLILQYEFLVVQSMAQAG